MITKLPEKLSDLRKYYGYSQQEIADRMGINVVEYMGWENGRSMCSLSQFKLLSAIFNVPLETLMDNTIHLQLANPLEDSIQIPFMNAETESIFFAQKEATQYIEGPVVEEAKRVVAKPTVETKSKSAVKKGKIQLTKQQWMIGGIGAAVLVLLLIAGLIFFPKGASSDLNLSIMNNQRIAAGDDFSIYIDQNQMVQQMGSGLNIAMFEDVVAVSAWKDFAVGLKENGTVVATGTNTQGQLEVEEWKDIVYISAGAEHTVGVSKDGTVLCTGSNRNQECNVTEWADVKFAEAGDGFTIGVTNEGEILIAGTVQNAGVMQNKTSVIDIAIGTKEVVFLKENLTVETVSYTGTTASNTAAWTGVTQIAAGSDFVAGLNQDGTVSVVTTNQEIAAQVATWENIKVIDGNKGYLLGFDGTVIIGAGDNSSSQFPANGEIETLDKVENIKISQEGDTITISWDAVTDAAGYLVEIDLPTAYSETVEETSVVIESSRFTEGKTYTISIVAQDAENEVFNSEASKVTYQHTLQPTPTPTFTLTIKYVDGNDKKMAEDYVVQLASGESYRVASPIVVGYTASVTYIEGIMGNSNMVEYVRYIGGATPTPTPDSTACLATGGTWNQESAKCVCPDGFATADDKLSCVEE
ncbi:MAG: helix-turn-helix domain-containing protein [Anaerorhabdus sp.]